MSRYYVKNGVHYGTADEMIDLIEELEAKLAKAVELETVNILVTSAYKEGWSDGSEFISLDVGWGESLTRTTLAELKGEK